jgi:hypothetical protein
MWGYGKFILGLIVDSDDTKTNRTSILPLKLLQERLRYFEKYLYVSYASTSSCTCMRGDLVTRCIREHPLDATRSALRSGSRQLDMLP